MTVIFRVRTKRWTSVDMIGLAGSALVGPPLILCGLAAPGPLFGIALVTVGITLTWLAASHFGLLRRVRSQGKLSWDGSELRIDSGLSRGPITLPAGTVSGFRAVGKGWEPHHLTASMFVYGVRPNIEVVLRAPVVVDSAFFSQALMNHYWRTGVNIIPWTLQKGQVVDRFALSVEPESDATRLIRSNPHVGYSDMTSPAITMRNRAQFYAWLAWLLLIAPFAMVGIIEFSRYSAIGGMVAAGCLLGGLGAVLRSRRLMKRIRDLGIASV